MVLEIFGKFADGMSALTIAAGSFIARMRRIVVKGWQKLGSCVNACLLHASRFEPVARLSVRNDTSGLAR
jgi:hypothetical protein